MKWLRTGGCSITTPISSLRSNWLQALTRDGWLLFITRFTRLFAYGSLSLVLVFYLTGLGLTEAETGTLFTLTLLGDTVISLYLTTRADRIGRRRMLVLGAILMAGAGLAFAFTNNLLFLIIAGTIGVISPSGNEVGPFLPIEQAALSHILPDHARTEVFAWYTLTGSFATAIGSLCSGILTQALQRNAMAPVGSYRVVVVFYAGIGFLLALLFTRLSSAAEVNSSGEKPSAAPSKGSFLGIADSRRIVLKLSGLFAMDSFSGGFIVQSFAVYWFYLRFGADPGTLGAIFFWANVFAGFSALLASRLAVKFGLLRTMVFTHLPSNILLILVPLMPNLSLAVALLLLRFSISQMDVPTRQSYTMAVVRPEERSAAAGITGVARTVGAAIAPSIAGYMFARPALMNMPFFVAGTLKIIYDLLLYKEFVGIQPPEETNQRP
ncbi:MAG TPA: MFS transporter [Candidatus Acidoferrales bacterium]|nr:MFS transporter [Candidatus Acidoferrales bacterium]